MACPMVKAKQTFLTVAFILETMSVVDQMAKENLLTQTVQLTLETGPMASVVDKEISQRLIILSMKATLRETSQMVKAK